jgi:anti-sigma regulatory factor (Ser/Thr protein kinase)
MSTRRSTDVGPDLAEVRSARRFVAATLSEWESSRADEAAIVASELVTNALVHAKTPVTVTVERTSSAIRIEVSDGSSVVPILRELSDTRTSGRGMRIVEELVDRWGSETHADGKTVWVELDQ